ncbi:uncharacterized protein BP01DRAFT_299046 [Aspergillus saccharolyticus JOP 1030-1]|uniref:Uncharacterized protein n=1 Tax=Aspergillus saccharolyticus JOP 1030-1 TaxID=1450539 RepID=A0A318ZVW7_9EURO|nr:hypothetical protein BP01DRAFT_299046 [Aspergillus saccharolyticus JOP 1030-1]PYH44278.1 hypothetical protein BP01DRAFT_299046 [Aspergillus saccharolyticus JOP 1030-1]
MSIVAPSLLDDTPSSSSSDNTSLDTRWAESQTAPLLLEDDGTGALVLPAGNSRRYPYLCLFHILDCHLAFDNAADWRTHIASHFRTHPPPKTARCPLCPGVRFGQDDAAAAAATAPATESAATPSAWDAMLSHVEAAHYQQGQTLAGSRPDFGLMQYLYGLRVISAEQFKAVQLPPAASSPAYRPGQEAVRAVVGSADEPYCAVYSRRREERVRRVRGLSLGVSI